MKKNNTAFDPSISPSIHSQIANQLLRGGIKLFWRPERPIKSIRKTSERYWGTTITQLRKKYPDVNFKSESASGVPVEWVDASGGINKNKILFLHGGGYAFGSISTYRTFAIRLSRRTGCPVLLVDYRLAPEHPFPAALEDVLKVYQWLLQRESSENIFVGGDSAGGGLTLSLSKLTVEQHCKPKGIFLLSPWADLSLGDPNGSHGKDYVLSHRHIRKFALYYAEEKNWRDPLVSPAYLDYADFPPIKIQVGSQEILLRDSKTIAYRARKAGVTVDLEIWSGMQHCWQVGIPQIPESKKALDNIGFFISSLSY